MPLSPPSCYRKPTPPKETRVPEETQAHEPEGHGLPRDLGDGLVMRKATPEDRERLADFHANTLLDIGQEGPDEPMKVWMLDLMSGSHPTFRPGDFLLVEDTTNGKIASSIGHIS